jgi:hypothetical protein
MVPRYSWENAGDAQTMANALEIARRGNVRLFRISPSLVTGSLSTIAIRSILKTNEACEGSRRTTKCERKFPSLITNG